MLATSQDQFPSTGTWAGSVPPIQSRAVRCRSCQPKRSDDPEETRGWLRYEDEFLIQLGLNGDEQALNQLFTRYARLGYRKALEILGNPEDAEDAVQEGLFSAFRNLRRFEGRSQFSTWVIRIVINAALMSLRRRRVPLPLSAEYETEEGTRSLMQILPDRRPTPEEAVAQQELREILTDVINQLPENSKCVLRHYLDGLSIVEIADIMSISLGTVKSVLHRARLKAAEGRRFTNQGIADNRRREYRTSIAGYGAEGACRFKETAEKDRMM